MDLEDTRYISSIIIEHKTVFEENEEGKHTRNESTITRKKSNRDKNDMKIIFYSNFLWDRRDHYFLILVCIYIIFT